MTSAPRLRKSLGQHHLRHGAGCRPAIEFLGPRDRTVVEIGPGGGVLTRELLDAGASVLGWELDLAWAAELRRRFRGEPLRIVAGDALELPWERLAPATRWSPATCPTRSRLRSSSGICCAAQHSRAPSSWCRTRWRSGWSRSPGTRAYGFLTVTTAALASVSVLARLPPGSFRPAPKVHGAFVGIERRAPVVALDAHGAVPRDGRATRSRIGARPSRTRSR